MIDKASRPRRPCFLSGGFRLGLDRMNRGKPHHPRGFANDDAQHRSHADRQDGERGIAKPVGAREEITDEGIDP